PRRAGVVHADPAAALVQDRRPPRPARSVLHPPAGREPLDAAPVRADSRAHRATRMASNVIAARTGSEGMRSEIESAGVSLKGMPGRAPRGARGAFVDPSGRRKELAEGCPSRSVRSDRARAGSISEIPA